MLSIRWAEESGRVLRSARYPCSIQARTVPPGCQARLPQSSSHSVARSFFCVPGWASLSGGFRQPSDSSLSPCGPGRFCGLTDTTFFSLRPMSSGRVLGMHAPLPLAVRQNPRTLIFLRPEPVVALISEPFARVLADFSRVRFSSPVARLSPRGSQGHTGQVTIFGQVTSRLLRSACHPCQFRLAALPDRLPSCVRIPTCKTFPGIRWRNESTNLCTRLSASAA
jgi:hypothetical protein